jgi:hypothetical protein
VVATIPILLLNRAPFVLAIGENSKGKAAGVPAAFVANENPGVDHPAATAASFMS